VSVRFLSRVCPRKTRDIREILPTSIERDVTFILPMGAFPKAIAHSSEARVFHVDSERPLISKRVSRAD
jgi:hypothetical protein